MNLSMEEWITLIIKTNINNKEKKVSHELIPLTLIESISKRKSILQT